MKDYVNTYKNYLQITKSDSTKDIIIAENKRIANEQSYLFDEMVTVNGESYHVMVRHDKKSESKKVIFKPDTKIDTGSVAEYREKHYLVMDFLGEGIYEIYPTATVQLCNATFPIKSNKTRVLLRDEEGNIKIDPLTQEPRYEWVEGQSTNVPCIVENKYRVSSSEEQIYVPQDELLITLPYYPEIVQDYKFTLYGNEHYKVLNVDRTKVIQDKGIIVLRVKREVK